MGRAHQTLRRQVLPLLLGMAGFMTLSHQGWQLPEAASCMGDVRSAPNAVRLVQECVSADSS